MEPCEFTYALQARRLAALATNLRQYSQNRLKAFKKMTESKEWAWLTVDEVAARLKVHAATVRRWVRDGQLTAAKAGRQHRISEEDLAVFLGKGQPHE